MATNPSIILSGNNFNDVYNDQRAKIAQAQAEQQAAQLQQLQVAQSKQAFDDDKNFRAAFIQANGDPDLTVKTAARLGVGPARIQAFVKSQADLQKTLLDNHKIQADTDKTNLDVMDAKHSQIHGALQEVLKAKPEEFETAKAFTIDKLQKDGVISDKEAAAAKDMDPSHLALYNATLLNVKQLSDQAKGEAATSNAAAATTQAGVATDKLAIEKAKAVTEQQEKARVDTANKLSDALSAAGPAGYAKALQGIDPTVAADFPKPEQIATMQPAQAASILNGMGMTGHERAQMAQLADNLAQTKIRDANTAANEARNTALRAKEVGIAASRESRESSSGAGATLETASPEVKTLAQGLVDGKYSPAEVRRMKGGEGALAIATQLDGTWTDQRYKTLNNFKTGKDSVDLANLVMLNKHIQTFKKASDAEGLHYGVETPGSTKVATVANDVSGVMGRLVKGGLLSVREHEEYMARLNSRRQGIRDAALESMQELVDGRVEGLKEKFEKGAGYPMPDSFLKGVQGGAATQKTEQPAPASGSGTPGRNRGNF